MTRYCTLARVKQQLKTDKTTDDSLVFSLLRVVSQRIDSILAAQPTRKRPYFAPYIEDRTFRIRPYAINSGEQTYNLNQYLLELTSLVTNGTTVTAVQGYVPNFPPFIKLQLTDSGANWYSLNCNGCTGRSYPEPITVNGIWGYHDDYDNAWLDTDTLQANVVTTTATTITVLNAADFSPGNLIKVNDEYMEVTAIDETPAPDELTVTRGVNGSTATIHTAADVVSIWQIAEQIQHITARQTGQFYARRAAYDISQLTNAGIVQYPSDLNGELLNTLAPYRMNTL